MSVSPHVSCRDPALVADNVIDRLFARDLARWRQVHAAGHLWTAARASAAVHS